MSTFLDLVLWRFLPAILQVSSNLCWLGPWPQYVTTLVLLDGLKAAEAIETMLAAKAAVAKTEGIMKIV